MSVRLLQVFDIENRWLFDGEKRLDASFYAKDVIASKILIGKLEESGIAIETIDTMSKDIFHRSRFKRNYVGIGEGLPFLTPTDLLMFPLKPRKSVVNPPEGLQVSPGWILITCSGTIGRTIIANRFISPCILSHDVIRIVPNNKNLLGYLYAYLNTWMGQAFLTKDRYGATVKHIEPHHVATIPIPHIPELEEEINQKVLEAHRLREEAQELLLKAEEMLYSELRLPKISEDDVEYFGGEKARIVKSFEIKASELNQRLDASYHEPIVQMVKSNLSHAKFPLQKLSFLAKSIFIPPRFKRPYTKNKSDSIPFLSGSHLIGTKPLDVKYLWKNFKRINLYKIYSNWILISARGTVGRPYLVTEETNGFTASDNIIRGIPDGSKILSSYLCAFLLTSYALYQIQAQKAGNVQDLLQPILLTDICVPVPPLDVQRKIGNLVFEAYDKRDKANQIEDEAIKLLERRLKEIAEGKL